MTRRSLIHQLFSVSYRRSSEGRGESEVPSGFRCSKCAPLTWTWLVVWNMNFIFPLIDGMSSFLLTNSIIFQDGYCTTHQGYIHHLWIISRSILHGYFNPVVFWYKWEYLRSPAARICHFLQGI